VKTKVILSLSLVGALNSFALFAFLEDQLLSGSATVHVLNIVRHGPLTRINIRAPTLSSKGDTHSKWLVASKLFVMKTLSRVPESAGAYKVLMETNLSWMGPRSL
jgi:hypothetical protein